MAHGPWAGDTIGMLTLVGTCDGQQIVNVHHFEQGPAGPAAVAPDVDAITWSAGLADNWLANAKTQWLACHPPDYTLTMVKAQVIERAAQVSKRLTPVERPQAAGQVGTALSAAEALQVAVCIKWRTAVAGKHSRGRSYIGPVPNGLISSGMLNTGIAGHIAFQQYADKLITQYKAGTGVDEELYRLTVYSKPYNMGEYQYATRKTGSLTVVTPPDYAGASNHVLVGVVDLVLRTQRRREVGVGS